MHTHHCEPDHDERADRDPAPDDVNLSRRTLLKRLAWMSLSVPALPALLAACGGDDDDDDAGSSDTPADPTATSNNGGSATAPASGASATSGGGPTPSATEPSGNAGEAQAGGTLRYGIHRDPIGLDPHINYGATSSSIQGNVYDTMIDYDEEGSLAPSLAESWEVEGDRTYTFKLRQGVTFQSGEPFTADDVVYSLDRILDEATGATRRPELSRLESYSAVDASTVEAVLTAPYATFLAVLATIEAAMISKPWSESNGDYVQNMNGTGPFMLDSFEPEVQYIFVKSPNYWQPDMPYLDGIEFYPTLDDTARVNALKSGQITFCEYVPWQEFEGIENDPAYHLNLGYDSYMLVRFNQQQAPLDNPLVRQALNYAVDREAIIQLAFGGNGKVITAGLIPQESSWYNQELDGHWSYDPDKATSLLAEAGISDPSSISLTFFTAPSSLHSQTAMVVAQQLSDLGLKIDLQTLGDIPTMIEKRKTGDYQLMQDGLGLPWIDPDFYSTFFETGAPGHAVGVNYSNAELDELLARGRSTLDQAERKKIYQQVEETLFQDPPWIFLYWRPQAEATTAGVQGYIRVPDLGLKSVAYLEKLWLKE